MIDKRRLVPFPAAEDLPKGADRRAEQSFEADDSVLEDFDSELRVSEAMGESAPRRSGDAATPWASSAELDRAVLPFRRPRNKKIRRLRQSALLRWLPPMAAALLIVGLPVAFVTWLLTAPSFALAGLEVRTAPAGRVTQAFIHQTLAPYGGRNLWRLDLHELEERIGAHPWISEVSLRKRPPATLIVQLFERRQAALYRAESGLAWVDASGQIIEQVDLGRPDPGLDLPILSGSPEALPAALELLEELASTGAGFADGLSEIEILGPRDFRIYSTSLPFPLVVRTGSLQSKARHLRALLPRLIERFETIDAVDLRFARRIIIQQPTAAKATGGQEQRA